MTQPTHIVMFPGNDPLIVAIDISASMHLPELHGAAAASSRMTATKEVVGDLIRRLPRDTPVTLLTVGRDVTVLCHAVPGVQARANLMLVEAGSAVCFAGLALEWALREHLQPRLVAPPNAPTAPDGTARINGNMVYDGYTATRANFVFVTDGEVGEDAVRWEAHRDLNAKHGSPLCVTVLTLGGAKGGDYVAGGGGNSRAMHAPLADVELRLSVPTGSDRPGDVEPAKRPTAPPSLSPPDGERERWARAEANIAHSEATERAVALSQAGKEARAAPDKAASERVAANHPPAKSSPAPAAPAPTKPPIKGRR